MAFKGPQRPRPTSRHLERMKASVKYGRENESQPQHCAADTCVSSAGRPRDKKGTAGTVRDVRRGGQALGTAWSRCPPLAGRQPQRAARQRAASPPASLQHDGREGEPGLGEGGVGAAGGGVADGGPHGIILTGHLRGANGWRRGHTCIHTEPATLKLRARNTLNAPVPSSTPSQKRADRCAHGTHLLEGGLGQRLLPPLFVLCAAERHGGEAGVNLWRRCGC